MRTSSPEPAGSFFGAGFALAAGFFAGLRGAAFFFAAFFEAFFLVAFFEAFFLVVFFAAFFFVAFFALFFLADFLAFFLEAFFAPRFFVVLLLAAFLAVFFFAVFLRAADSSLPALDGAERSGSALSRKCFECSEVLLPLTPNGDHVGSPHTDRACDLEDLVVFDRRDRVVRRGHRIEAAEQSQAPACSVMSRNARATR